MFKNFKKSKGCSSKIISSLLVLIITTSYISGIFPVSLNKVSAKTIDPTNSNGVSAQSVNSITLNGTETQKVESISTQAGKPVLRNFIDTDLRTQTHYMMTGDNFLLLNYWMNASIQSTTGQQEEKFNVTLQFTIPGYNCCTGYKNLLFYIFDKNQNNPSDMKEYRLTTSTADKTPKIFLENLSASNYEVHVYKDSLAEENFVAKSEFCCCPSSVTSLDYSFSVNLLDASGAPILDNRGVPYKVIYETPKRIGSNQFSLYLPKVTSILPYNSHTIKVVFFATNRADGKSPNIDKDLYEYIFDGYNLYDDMCFQFCPDAQAGIDISTSYEAHFYRDNVLPGNFICKAVGITNSQN